MSYAGARRLRECIRITVLAHRLVRCVQTAADELDTVPFGCESLDLLDDVFGKDKVLPPFVNRLRALGDLLVRHVTPFVQKTVTKGRG